MIYVSNSRDELNTWENLNRSKWTSNKVEVEYSEEIQRDTCRAWKRTIKNKGIMEILYYQHKNSFDFSVNKYNLFKDSIRINNG